MAEQTQTIDTRQRIERLMDSMLTVEHSEPYPHEDGTMGGEYSDYVYDEDHNFRNLIAAEIDGLTAERDGLKAALAASWPNLSAQLSEARANLRLAEIRINGFINGQEDAAAEVERLRLPAEAWEAQEASLYADANADSYAETGYMRHKAEAAAARAREAAIDPLPQMGRRINNTQPPIEHDEVTP